MPAIDASQKRTLEVLAYLLYRMGLDQRADKVWAALSALAQQDGHTDRTALLGRAAAAISRGDGEAAYAFLRLADDGSARSSADAAELLLKAQALWLLGRENEARSVRDEYIFITGNKAEQ